MIKAKIFYFGVLIFFLSCDQTLPYIEITDTSIHEIITDFVEANSLEKDEDYLTLSVFTAGNREIIFLKHDKYLYETLEAPTFYSQFNGWNVLVFTNVNSYFKVPSWEVARATLESNGLKIQRNTTGFSYHPAIWKLVRCGEGKFKIDDSIVLTEYFLQCGKRFNPKLNMVVEE